MTRTEPEQSQTNNRTKVELGVRTRTEK
jgi:hypothetical protein